MFIPATMHLFSQHTLYMVVAQVVLVTLMTVGFGPLMGFVDSEGKYKTAPVLS